MLAQLLISWTLLLLTAWDPAPTKLMSIIMPASGHEVPLPIQHAVVNCRLLYRSSFTEIERRVGVLRWLPE